MGNPSERLRLIYERIDGDFESVCRRFSKEEKVMKYLIKFAASSDYLELEEAYKNLQYDVIFRNTHNIKGVAANLGFTDLFNKSDTLCEMTRGGDPGTDISGNVDEISAAYRKVIAALNDMIKEGILQ